MFKCLNDFNLVEWQYKLGRIPLSFILKDFFCLASGAFGQGARLTPYLGGQCIMGL